MVKYENECHFDVILTSQQEIPLQWLDNIHISLFYFQYTSVCGTLIFVHKNRTDHWSKMMVALIFFKSVFSLEFIFYELKHLHACKFDYGITSCFFFQANNHYRITFDMISFVDSSIETCMILVNPLKYGKKTWW